MHHAGRNGEHFCVPFNLNNTSCGFLLKEVDWGGKHPISVVDWQSHETYPTGHNISEVDWGALHDSSFFLFPDPLGPEPVPSGPISSTKPTGYSTAAVELMGFTKGIKREIAAYPPLRDERYFDGFMRSLFIVAKSHECNEVFDPASTPSSEPEQQELFEVKQTIIFSVFNANLQTDMGKTIVRRH